MFDLKKPYDSTWRHGILSDLFNLGTHGKMLGFIPNYRAKHSFQVRLGNTLSREFVQEDVVPQGRVLSVSLFIVKLNSVAHTIPAEVQYSLYAADLQVSVSSCNLAICERQLQVAINNLAKWADENGLGFFPKKGNCDLLFIYVGFKNLPSLKLYNAAIPVKSEHKFLGLVLYNKLTFGPHIKSLKMRC